MSQISRQLNRPAWEYQFLQNASTAVNASAEAVGWMAAHLERQGRLDDADEWAKRGLRKDASDPTCLLVSGKVLRRKKEFTTALECLRSVTSRSSAPISLVISAYHESANIKDALGDCAGAIADLTAGKTLLLNHSDVERLRQRSLSHQQNHHHFLTSIDAGYFERAGGWSPRQRRRLALLAGHPRSGTTLLEQILDSHTDLISAEEVPAFGELVNDPMIRDAKRPDLAAATLATPLERVELLRAAYFETIQAVLDQPIGERLLIDKNPSYTDCIPMFARVFPEALFIVALRDPRDVVLSCFFQDLALNEITLDFTTLESTAVRYANTMAMWLLCREHMDPSRWIEARYEALVKDLPTEAGRVMNHLHLDLQPAQSHPERHARHRSVISPTYADVREPVHQAAIGRWKRYERWLAPALPILETFIEAFEY